MNLIKDFGKKRVINDLSLNIQAGEIVTTSGLMVQAKQQLSI